MRALGSKKDKANGIIWIKSLDDMVSRLGPKGRRRDVGTFCLFVAGDTSPEVHLVRSPELRFHDNLVTEVQSTKDGNTQVTGKEGRCSELSGEETIEASGEDEDNDPEHTPVGQPWLESVVVREFGTIDTLLFTTIVETEERDVHRQPSEEATCGSESLKPVEHLSSGFLYRKERNEGETGSE